MRKGIGMIGGFDPSGGAGILADLRAARAIGVEGIPILTCLTLQTDERFDSLQPIPKEHVEKQIHFLLEHPHICAVKIGALGFADLPFWEGQLAKLKSRGLWIVFDPVYLSSSQGILVASTDAKALGPYYLKLASHCDLLTPNLAEASLLLGRRADPETIARELGEQVSCYLLLKGGHTENLQTCEDLFYRNGQIHRFPHRRIEKKRIRGTGCMLATAIASFYALEREVYPAVRQGIETLQQWILKARPTGEDIFHLL